MIYNCGCSGRTIEIDTTFYTYLTIGELDRRCHEPNNGSEISNPWSGSYLETGDREVEEDEDDQIEIEDPTPYIDYSLTGLDPEGYE